MTRPGATARRADPLAVHSGPGARVVAAPAKLNLFLEIIAKRPDGYHDLESLMVAIDLFDTLEIQTRTDSTLALTCDPPSLSTGPDNLVYKAAVALRARAGRTQLGATIHLTKRVPMQAGLGGGSSDAAAALVGLNEIWKLGLTREELVAIAATIGSDVAFFLTPDMSAAWCTGRGEVVAPEEPPARGFHFVLVCPPVGLGTAGVYKRLTVPPEPNSGAALRAAAPARGVRPVRGADVRERVRGVRGVPRPGPRGSRGERVRAGAPRRRTRIARPRRSQFHPLIPLKETCGGHHRSSHQVV